MKAQQSINFRGRRSSFSIQELLEVSGFVEINPNCRSRYRFYPFTLHRCLKECDFSIYRKLHDGLAETLYFCRSYFYGYSCNSGFD